MDIKLAETTILKREDIVPVEWNPNEMSPKDFNALVYSIEKEGWLVPIQVVPIEDGKYEVVGGEHRLKAAELLELEEVSAIVLSPEEYDEDRKKFLNVKLNVIHGKLSPQKFVKLVMELEKKYSRDVIETMMGFADKDAFEALIKQVRNSLPHELKPKFDETKNELKTIDDLSLLLNTLFSKYGDTLDQNFMVFSYGGKSHLWVIMDADLKKMMLDDLTERMKVKRLDMNKFFKLLIIDHGDEVFDKLAAMEPDPVEPERHDEELAEEE